MGKAVGVLHYILNYLLLEMPARWLLQNHIADKDISWVSSCLQSQTNIPVDLNTPATRTRKDETLRLRCYATFHISRILWWFSTVHSLLDTIKSAVFKEFLNNSDFFSESSSYLKNQERSLLFCFPSLGIYEERIPGALTGILCTEKCPLRTQHC